MKNLVFAFALLFSTSLVAQFSYNENGTGIQSATNNASGDNSTAIGGYSQANGNQSLSTGWLTRANGWSSTAFGHQSNAKGNISSVFGRYTVAEDFLSFAIGVHNKADETPNPTQFSLQNTAFVIGNGGYDSEGNYDGHLSNAFEVLFNGSTTIAGNVTAPAFIGDGSQLTNLPTPTVNYSDITNVPISFNVNGTGIQSSSNTASGDFSTAMGYQSEASGSRSTAMGSHTTASGNHSTAMGYDTTASGDSSTTMGYFTTASGPQSTAMGYYTTASGDSSTTMGYFTTASGPQSTAMGYYTTASGNHSTAMGYDTTASGDFTTAAGVHSVASGFCSTALGAGPQAIGGWSTALGGFTIANGRLSTAMGEETITDDYGTTVIGVWNKIDETPNPDTFSFENAAFVIGNGGYDNQGNYLGGADETRSNAFEVLFDGTTTIAGDLNINSDARLKANIISLGATLSKLLQIDGKTYTMKKDANHKKKIGLLAQDIEKVFPELVTETNDIKSVNYQGLVPVLINAMKEQDEVIRSQDAINKKQQREIDELKTMVKQLMSK